MLATKGYFVCANLLVDNKAMPQSCGVPLSSELSSATGIEFQKMGFARRKRLLGFSVADRKFSEYSIHITVQKSRWRS